MASNGNSSIFLKKQPCYSHRHSTVGTVSFSAYPGGPHFLWDPSGKRGLRGMDSSLASLPCPTLAWERPQEERGEGSIRSDSELPWEASINPGKPLGTGQSHPWVAVRPGEQTIVTWTENKSSEKCSREGVSPASTFPSQKGVAFFSHSPCGIQV